MDQLSIGPVRAAAKAEACLLNGLGSARPLSRQTKPACMPPCMLVCIPSTSREAGGRNDPDFCCVCVRRPQDHISAFSHAWSKVDTQGTSYVDAMGLTTVLMHVPPPLGVQGLDRPHLRVQQIILAVDIPLRCACVAVLCRDASNGPGCCCFASKAQGAVAAS